MWTGVFMLVGEMAWEIRLLTKRGKGYHRSGPCVAVRDSAAPVLVKGSLAPSGEYLPPAGH
jgi:hypothetical protein